MMDTLKRTEPTAPRFDADTIALATEPLKLYLASLEEIDDDISLIGQTLLNSAVEQMERALIEQASYPLS